jgi:hypothetical protein
MKNTPIARFTVDHKNQIADLLSEIGYDGHTIWKASILEDFPQDIICRFVRAHKSNKKDYKSTIFDNDGNIVEECEGIYGLSLLRVICSDLGLTDWESKIGRGFQAQEYTKSIMNWLEHNGVALSAQQA